MTGAARPGPRGFGGALWLIACLLLGSGLLRLGIEAGPAVAREVTALGSAVLDPEPEEGCTPEPGVAALLKALNERETRLAERELALSERLAALDLAEAAVARQLSDLEAAEERLAGTLALAETAAEDDIARLTSVYENMKPKEAAALFETMAPDFAAGFLGRMRPDAAAAIMAGLAPDVAYSISVRLAGRNAAAPRE